MAQTFNSKQIHYMNNGSTTQLELEDKVNEAFNHNIFNDNFIIASMPGLGKTHTMLTHYDPDKHILIEGNSSPAEFFVKIATAVYLAQGVHITIILDDCDILFSEQFANTTKKMFDGTNALKYNKARKGLKSFCNDIQWEAINCEDFTDDMSVGFSVPLDNVTFIILSNRLLPTDNQVNALEEGTKKHTVATDLLAIRGRTEYGVIDMTRDDLWGYIAHIILTTDICEVVNPDITQADKEQICLWFWTNWRNVTERNLRLVEKLVKDMVRFPNNYLDIWDKRYTEVTN